MHMTKLISALIIIGAGITLSACSLLPQNATPQPEETQEIEAQTELMNENVIIEDASVSALPSGTAKPLTSEEVSLHSTPDDCWMNVENKVYDVTAYIAMQKHPGGAAILEGCGKEAATLFMTRPMGSGTEHSPKAQDMLKQYYLGELVATTQAQPTSSDSGDLGL